MIKEKAYQNLSDMVYKGFLTTALDLAGTSFVFKTVNEKEYDLIKLYAGINNNSYTSRFNMYFLVFSLLLVDGENVLKNRENKVKELYELFNNLPNVLYVKISEELRKLRVLAEDIIDFLEGFSYTGQSRKIWRLSNSKLPSSEDLTGIPGTNNIGLNVYQENWVLINKMLDEEEQYDHDFSLSILVASASNPKGTRGLSSRHDAKRQTNKERRDKLAKKGSSKSQDWKPSGWAAPVDTADELVAELMRQMQGKKDKHDLFIEEHMSKIKEKADAQTKKAEQKLEKIRQKRKEEGGPSIVSSQRALSKQESDELMSKKSNNLLLISEDVEQKEEKSRFLKKVGSKILTARE